jgi:hypothetical protein
MSNNKPDRDDRETQPQHQEDQNIREQPAGNAEDDDDDWGINDASDVETGEDEHDDDADQRTDRDDTASPHHREATAEPPSDKGDQAELDELLIDDLEEEQSEREERKTRKAEEEETEEEEAEEEEAEEEEAEGEEAEREEAEEEEAEEDENDDDENEEEEEKEKEEEEEDESEVKHPRRQNAVKHGAFVKDLLPDEDPLEFERLHESLRDEWKPDGPTQEEAVLSLAHAYRAVHRLERFSAEELELTAESPLLNEVNLMIELTEILENKRREAVAREIVGQLPETVRQHLNRKYPRANFEDPQRWIAALVAAMPDLLEVHATAATREQADLTWRTGQAARRHEVFEKTTKLKERLDCRVDKCLRRLIDLKTHQRISKSS